MIESFTGFFTDGLHIIASLTAVVIVAFTIAWTLVLVGWGLLISSAYIARWIILYKRRRRIRKEKKKLYKKLTLNK